MPTGVSPPIDLPREGSRFACSTSPTVPPVLPPADLVIDAAYGTGFHGVWKAPAIGDAPVLAVDIPSGVDGLTGAAARDAAAPTAR